MIKIKSMHIYPIKGLGGISLNQTEVTTRGLKHDRRWVLVDENNRFISQREFPEMALLHTHIEGELLTVTDTRKQNTSISIRVTEPKSNEEMVTVWDDTMPAKMVSEEANDWFTLAIGTQVRLMFMHDDSQRQADQRYAISENDHVSFADGYPILIVSEASMDQLNKKTGLTQAIDRFRANIVITGTRPHEEDELKEISIGEQKLYGVKPCARCQVTTIDPSTAQYGKEPLKTLASYRKINHKILFGENFIPSNESIISVGDKINVIERKEPAIRS